MKMEVKTEAYDVGVIVGRFQVHELHDAHRSLIQTVCSKHDKVLIFLGLSPLRGTTENPLDFESRKQMILKEFPQVNVLYIKDMWSDELWSKRLDEMIGDVVTPSQTVVLYGGRDSFMAHYGGRYATQELVQEVWMSGSELRKAIASRSAKASPDFRAGVVWAAHNRFPTCYPTVDVAIFKDADKVIEGEAKILLGRKAAETKYRLIGGFADPKSHSYEADARREVEEEAHIEITDPEYLSSMIIDDWRYRSERDKIKTLLFTADYQFGSPRPDDDIAEVRWFTITHGEQWYYLDGIHVKDIVMPAHTALVSRAIGDRVIKAKRSRGLLFESKRLQDRKDK